MSYSISTPNDDDIERIDVSQSGGVLSVVVKRKSEPDVTITVSVTSDVLWEIGNLFLRLAENASDNDT